MLTKIAWMDGSGTTNLSYYISSSSEQFLKSHKEGARVSWETTSWKCWMSERECVSERAREGERKGKTETNIIVGGIIMWHKPAAGISVWTAPGLRAPLCSVSTLSKSMETWWVSLSTRGGVTSLERGAKRILASLFLNVRFWGAWTGEEQRRACWLLAVPVWRCAGWRKYRAYA